MSLTSVDDVMNVSIISLSLSNLQGAKLNESRLEGK